jgi:hypothetical protein
MIVERISNTPSVLLGLAAAALFSTALLAAPANLDNVRLANDVVPAPFGYEAAPARYTVGRGDTCVCQPVHLPRARWTRPS